MDLITNYRDLLSEYGLTLLIATRVSLELLVISSVLGFVLAIFVAVGRSSRHKLIYTTSTIFSSVFRGTPLLVQLFVIYYGLGQFEAIRSSFLWTFFSSSFFCASLALTLNVAAYMSEHIRAGILSIPHGESEAALALGVGDLSLLAGITVPRALRVAMPALTNEIISQLKSTALASTITVLDLTGVARRLSAQTYTLDALIVAGFIYAMLTLFISVMARGIERKGNVYLKKQAKFS
ncbi:ABC transporter permease [Paraburkholderia sp.]|uniref:ABC transporter permease n=1 Tax=Paraburkholderia sp. TaxID=1926495 RepID=UPI003C7B733E